MKRRHIDSSSNDNGDSVGVCETDSAEEIAAKSLQILERAQSPNFEELARHSPGFRKAWQATKSLQKERNAPFSSCVTQEFSIELSRAILQTLFRLQLPHLDEFHLCPPIPNRFFYLHWIHTKLMRVNWLVGTIPSKRSFVKSTKGLDIGSGASCIYSLLAARFFGSSMITSEIDHKSMVLACANVGSNQLSNKITVFQVPPSYSQQQQQQSPKLAHEGGPLQRSLQEYHRRTIHPIISQSEQLDYVMTNPPFYDPNSMEISTARVGDGRARTNMTVSEGNYPGGEMGFVTEMIEDSLRMSPDGNSGCATWYSSMLGKKTSLVKLQKLLVHLLGPAHVETTEYGPGHYTRWFLAWTLHQPPATASGALCPHVAKDNFQVILSEPLLPHIAVSQVANRIKEFCDSGPGGWDVMSTTDNTIIIKDLAEMTMTIVETMPPSVNLFVDEQQKGVEIPESILRVLRERDNSKLLPDEGHFLVQVQIRAVAAVTKNQFSDETAVVDVHLNCFSHSMRGKIAITTIRDKIEGEVCRTNRKWRKIRERQQQQQQ